MYMPPVVDPERSVIENQTLFERMVANDLRIGPGDKVLDLTVADALVDGDEVRVFRYAER